MAFSDDDLKRLKEAVKYISDRPQERNYGQPLQIGQFRALIARLEASEALNKYFEPSDGSIEEEQLFKAWRKAAGRTE